MIANWVSAALFESNINELKELAVVFKVKLAVVLLCKFCKVFVNSWFGVEKFM